MPLLALSFILSKPRPKLHFLPILTIPIIEPKLALLPFSIAALNLLWAKERKKAFVPVFVSLIILIVLWKPFLGQTIFTPDYEARQEVIRKTQLYPSVFTARLFQNKARIYIDKITDNFFALIDPNNYFFGFAPRQIVNNQNLNKYPFLSILFALYGLYSLGKSENKNMLVSTLFAGVFTLSMLTVFDRNDFILWLPVSLIFVHGVNRFKKEHPNKARLYFLIFLFFALPELIKIFVQFSQ